MRSVQDILREYRDAGEISNALHLLRSLVDSNRGQERKYPDSKPKGKARSSDWQLTRSLATRAVVSGSYDDFPLLALHIRDAFQEREEDEPLEERIERAREVFSAIVEALEKVNNPDERRFFQQVDAAADYAIYIIEKERRFPTKEEVIESLAKHKLTISQQSEATKILACAYLSFLPKKEGKRGTTGHSMKVGFREKR